MIRAAVAMDEKQGIADDYGIPWQGKIPGDVKFYLSKVQNGDPILYGYGLYIELSKPYKNGQNYVATKDRTKKLRPGFTMVEDAIEFLKKAKGDVWDLGGAGIFAATIDYIDEIYVTQLEGDFHCTKFFPPFKDQFELVKNSDPVSENGITYRFQVWKRTKAYV